MGALKNVNTEQMLYKRIKNLNEANSNCYLKIKTALNSEALTVFCRF